MKNKRAPWIILIWLLITAGIRVLHYLFAYSPMRDTFGYFDNAVANLEGQEKLLSSGLGFAYSRALGLLSTVLGTENSWIYSLQLVLELFALWLLFLGIKNLWSMKAALLSCSLLSLSPILLDMLKVVSPEEFFLFFFSVIFYFMSLFCRYTRYKKWTMSFLNALIVLLMGGYVGIMCAWNYLGLLLTVIIFVIVVKNFGILRDKTRLQNLIEYYGADEDKRIMTVFSQCLILFIGTGLGFFLTLYRYTFLSGMTLLGQVIWWLRQFNLLPKRTMDFDTEFAVYLVAAVLLGLLINTLSDVKAKRRAKKNAASGNGAGAKGDGIEEAFVNRNIFDEETPKKRFRYPVGIMPKTQNKVTQDKHKTNEESKAEECADYKSDNKNSQSKEFFITEDGRQIHYLENPLPLPKKHIPKGNMQFDLEESPKPDYSPLSNDISSNNYILNKYNSNKDALSKDALSKDALNKDVLSKDALSKDSLKDDFDLDIKDGDDFDF